MKQLWKRNAVVGTILVFVCAAIFLNGKYAEKVEKPTKILGQAQQVDGADGRRPRSLPERRGRITSPRPGSRASRRATAHCRF